MCGLSPNAIYISFLCGFRGPMLRRRSWNRKPPKLDAP